MPKSRRPTQEERSEGVIGLFAIWLKEATSDIGDGSARRALSPTHNHEAYFYHPEPISGATVKMTLETTTQGQEVKIYMLNSILEDNSFLGWLEAHGQTAFVVMCTRSIIWDKLPVRLRNPHTEVLIIPAKTIIGQFTSVEIVEDQQQVHRRDRVTLHICEAAQMCKPTELLSHLTEVATGWCNRLNPAKWQQVDQLTFHNADVFSKDDMDVGRTTMVKHSIPLVRDYRHGPVQEAEIQRHVTCKKYLTEISSKTEMGSGGSVWTTGNSMK